MAKIEVAGICEFYNQGSCMKPVADVFAILPEEKRFSYADPEVVEVIKSIEPPLLAEEKGIPTAFSKQFPIEVTGPYRWNCEARRLHRGGGINAEVAERQKDCDGYKAGPIRKARVKLAPNADS